mgnify:FL=1
MSLLEACVGSYASSKAAYQGGADRLELCANLVIGGTTPSRALFLQVQRDFDIKINVMIRPRFGDFLYDEAELEEMCAEIASFRDLGANGVVFGVLTPEGELDEARMARLISCAGNMDVTLHRAFDMTRDPFAALESAIRLGCKTILTSGQAADAMQGSALLRELHKCAAGRIDIMAGCGVNSGNLLRLHERTGVTSFHASAKRTAQSAMRYRKESVSMGLPSLSEYQLWQTDEAAVRACAEIVHRL